MILWCDGAHDPAENMRRDAALLAAADALPDFEPVLRLYGFEPHGITFGYAQAPAVEADLERCARDGVPWAVRPTGGRAVFHAEEWTYSLAARVDDPRWGGSLGDAYDAISRLLVGALNRLGVPARHAAGSERRGAVRASTAGDRGSTPFLGDGTADARRWELASRVAPACFASTARHEVVLDGRKLVGSAQRRTARALLQQGSLLLGPGHSRLADYLAGDEDVRASRRARLAAASSGAGGHLGGDLRLERWADALHAELNAPVRRLEGEIGLELLVPVGAGAPPS